MKKYLSVSIHDVAPRKKVEEIRHRLYDIGIDKVNLLIVPCWHGRYDLRAHPGFVRWLHRQAGKGDEHDQHGVLHMATKRRDCDYDSYAKWIMGEVVSDGSAEFQNYNADDTEEMLDVSDRIFGKTGIEPAGMIYPWWTSSAEARRVVAESGRFRFYIDKGDGWKGLWNLFGRMSRVPITDLQSGAVHSSRELCFEPRDKVANAFTKGLAWLVTQCEEQQTIRFGIHPPDLGNKELFSYILQLIDKVRPGRELVTYRELLGL